MFCHGNHEDHCCYIKGRKCDNLLEGEQILVFLETLVYSLDGSLDSVKDLSVGVSFACSIPLEITARKILKENTLPDKEELITEWLTHYKYGPIADIWVELGLPYSYCTDYGPKQGQCCFSESYTLNYERANNIPVSVRKLRRFL